MTSEPLRRPQRATRLRAGVCSVTLRDASPSQVVEAAVRAKLEVIEWGADVHVHSGDPTGAAQVRELTEDAGLAVGSYGSYYRTGGDRGQDFEPVLESAIALAAPRLRVWAGNIASAEADTAQRERVVADARRIARLAADAGVRIGFEYHEGTLNDGAEASARLLADVDDANVTTYWQPPNRLDDERVLADLESIMAQVDAVHAFSWWPYIERHALARRETLWHAVMSAFARRGAPTDVLLEFVRADDVTQLVDDARTLRAMIARVNEERPTHV